MENGNRKNENEKQKKIRNMYRQEKGKWKWLKSLSAFLQLKNCFDHFSIAEFCYILIIWSAQDSWTGRN